MWARVPARQIEGLGLVSGVGEVVEGRDLARLLVEKDWASSVVVGVGEGQELESFLF